MLVCVLSKWGRLRGEWLAGSCRDATDDCVECVLVESSIDVENSWFCCVMIPLTCVLPGCFPHGASITWGMADWLCCDATDVLP